jgi:hypothetical protein
MTDPIRELEREMRADALSSVRFRLVCLVFIVSFGIPGMRSLFHSMNVALPYTTSAILYANEAISGWWFLVFPALFYLWRRFERGWVSTATIRELRAAACMLALGILLIAHAIYVPLARLVNNVG